MAARSKVGQATILDSSTILWPPRLSAFRIASGTLAAAAIAQYGDEEPHRGSPTNFTNAAVQSSAIAFCASREPTIT